MGTGGTDARRSTISFGGGRPPQAIPPIRVYLDVPGGVTIQLIPVYFLELWEPREDEPDQLDHVRLFHAFGPAHAPAPPPGTVVRVEPVCRNGEEPPDVSDVRVVVRRYQSVPWDCVRFAPAAPLVHTNS